MAAGSPMTKRIMSGGMGRCDGGGGVCVLGDWCLMAVVVVVVQATGIAGGSGNL